MAAPKLNPPVAGWAGVAGACCVDTPPNEKVGAEAGSMPTVLVVAPKVEVAVVAAAPKAKGAGVAPVAGDPNVKGLAAAVAAGA
jgi:hypothetical protein